MRVQHAYKGQGGAAPGPLGVVLAGGTGRRLGGSKATADLGGRPLLSWALGPLREVLGDVVVVAKADTVLPADLTVAVWIEPAEPRHPITGLLHALAQAGGRPVLVCAVDMPFVSVATVRALATAPGAGTVLAADPRGRIQPLLGRYPPEATATLGAAATDARLTAVVQGLQPALVPVAAAELVNVNTPQDLADATVKARR